MDRVTTWRLIALLVLALLVVTLWSGVFASTSEVLSVSFLDVGQGDAVFLQTPSGRQVLIDGGSNMQVLRSLGSVMAPLDRTLDVLIATHPDADHIGGLPEVLKRFEVGVVMDTGATNDTSVYELYRKYREDEVLREGAAYVTARRGQVIDFGDGVLLRVLFPDRALGDDVGNDGSVILQAIYGDTEVLLTGDAGQGIETYLALLEGTFLESDILKVGHHGSKTSSAPLFLATAAPTVSVISAGCKNRYGHPHEEVLEILRQFSKEILGTCEEGTITFVSDGKSFTQESESLF